MASAVRVEKDNYFKYYLPTRDKTFVRISYITAFFSALIFFLQYINIAKQFEDFAITFEQTDRTFAAIVFGSVILSFAGGAVNVFEKKILTSVLFIIYAVAISAVMIYFCLSYDNLVVKFDILNILFASLVTLPASVLGFVGIRSLNNGMKMK